MKNLWKISGPGLRDSEEILSLHFLCAFGGAFYKYSNWHICNLPTLLSREQNTFIKNIGFPSHFFP